MEKKTEKKQVVSVHEKILSDASRKMLALQFAQSGHAIAIETRRLQREAKFQSMLQGLEIAGDSRVLQKRIENRYNALRCEIQFLVKNEQFQGVSKVLADLKAGTLAVPATDTATPLAESKAKAS